MKQPIFHSLMLVAGFCFILFACNQPAKTDEAEKTDKDTTKIESASMPAYDPAMDPLKVEAAFAKVLADTLNVKLYEVTLNPGDSVGLHTHPDNAVYVIEGGTGEIKLKDGSVQAVEFKKGMGLIGGSVTHSGKNTGTTTIKLLIADIYRPRE